MADRKVTVAERDNPAAIRLIEKIEKNGWDYRKIAGLFGSDPERMKFVFTSSRKWNNYDLAAWRKAFRKYSKYVDELKLKAGETRIDGPQKKGLKGRKAKKSPVDHTRKKERLSHQIACLELMERLKKSKKFKLASYPQTCARQFDFLFISLIESPAKRQSKLSRIFSLDFSKGDDIYLRYMLEMVERASDITLNLSQRYRAEVLSLGGKRK